MSTPESTPLPTPPPSGSTTLVDFEWAEVVSPMIFPPEPVLVVRGTKPHPAMTVELVPLRYIQRPEYWGVEVVGSTIDTGPTPMPAIANVPYAVELRLDDTIGTVGVEVVGASSTKRIPLTTPGTGETTG
jgi:hypothetical protein